MNKNMIKLKNLFKTKSSKGFTLLELILAAFMSSIVLTAAGWALLQIMQASAQSEDKSLARLELNRALDFMANEVKMAKEIIDPSTVTVSPPSGTTEEEKILALEIPDTISGVDGDTYQVVYYIAKPPTSSVWSGERAIYRQGPFIDIDGKPSDPNDDGNIVDTEASGQTYNKVLIDNISHISYTSLSSEYQKDCDPKISSSSQYPATNDRKGFYVCVSSNKKIGQIFVLGVDRDGNLISTVDSLVYARSSETPSAPSP